jgi:HAD superfamily hydrolase (TIGR01509 family)
VPAAILDIDGTLVDSNYQHVIAWQRAFARSDEFPPMWSIHQHMGMGGDQLVQAIAGEEFERRRGDSVREAESGLFRELLPEVRPIEGAARTIRSLADAGWAVVLSSSAKPDEVDHYVDLLDAADLAGGRTDAGDVEETKPSPDLIESALAEAGSAADEGAIMVGDSTWDIEAAAKAGVPAVAVLTGGYPESDLRESGALEVFASVADINDRVLESLVTGR